MLCCAVLCCAVLCCAVLCCAVLCLLPNPFINYSVPCCFLFSCFVSLTVCCAFVGAAGGIAELFASVIFVPVDVIRTQLQLGANPHRATGGLVDAKTNHANARAAWRNIYRQQVQHLYICPAAALPQRPIASGNARLVCRVEFQSTARLHVQFLSILVV